MFQIQKIIVAATLLIGLGTARAQEPVSLQDALQYAVQNSEVIQQARLDIQSVHEKVRETRASALPQINVTSTLTNNVLAQQFVLPAEAFGGEKGEFMSIKAGQTWNGIAQVQLSQQIYNQQLFTGLKAAKSSVEFYELAEKVSVENVLQQVAVNFYQVIVTREKLNVIDANLRRVETLEEMIAGQYANGLAKKIDLDRVKVNKSNLKTQRLELENAAAQQENLLKYYMGMPIHQEITLVTQPLEQIRIPAGSILKNSTVDTRGLNSYKMVAKQAELLDLQRRAEVAEGYPTLSLGANYMYNTQSDRFNLYTPKALNYDMSAVNLTLRVPIFDGNARKARVKQTEYEILKVREEMSKTNNALQMALQNAHKQMSNSLEAITQQKANMQLAEEVFTSTQNNYKNGLASLTDLLNSETELVTAQNSYHEALLNYKIAETDLLKAKGEIDQLLTQN